MLVVAVLWLALAFARSVLVSYGAVIPGIELAFFVLLFLIYPRMVKNLYIIATSTFVVEEGCLDGIDLWNVESVRYGRHYIALDGVRIYNVPKPKVLIKSLEDFYINMTGEWLP